MSTSKIKNSKNVDNSTSINDSVNDGSTDLHERLSSAMKRATLLLHECTGTQQKTAAILERARELASKAGLTVDSYVVNPNHPANTSTFGVPEDYIVDAMDGSSAATTNNAWQTGGQHTKGTAHPVFASHHYNSTMPPMMRGMDNVNQTGAYSNTDHYVQRTGDKRADRIAELKRHLLRRHRSMKPEDRGEERWDKPKLPGERRRRIVREKDLDTAPPEPPATGWVAFLSQMTYKIRHDRPKNQHDQAKSA
jgi:hypothetical protein